MATAFVAPQAAACNVPQDIRIGLPFSHARGRIMNVEALIEVISDMADAASGNETFNKSARAKFEQIMKLTYVALEETKRAIGDVDEAEDGVLPFVQGGRH